MQSLEVKDAILLLTIKKKKKQKKKTIRNQERASNIKIKAILPLVFGVHQVNRFPLLL